MLRSLQFILLVGLLSVWSSTSIARQNTHHITSGIPYEITLDANQSNSILAPDVYQNELTVTFTNESYGSISVKGFWHGRHGGQSIWKARFSPEIAGNWTWTTSFTDTTDAGLHNRNGSF